MPCWFKGTEYSVLPGFLCNHCVVSSTSTSIPNWKLHSCYLHHLFSLSNTFQYKRYCLSFKMFCFLKPDRNFHFVEPFRTERKKNTTATNYCKLEGTNLQIC